MEYKADIYKQNIDDHYKFTLIKDELEKIEFNDVAAIRQFIIDVKTSPIKNNTFTVGYDNLRKIIIAMPIYRLPILAGLKELYDNEYSYVRPEDLADYRKLIVQEFNNFVQKLDDSSDAELQAIISAQQKAKEERVFVIQQNLPKPPAGLTPEQIQAIRAINASNDNFDLIGFTTKPEEAQVCIDCGTTILNIQELYGFIERNQVPTDEANIAIHNKLMNIIDEYYKIMETYFGYDIDYCTDLLSQDRIGGVYTIIQNILIMFNSSRITMDEFNKYDYAMRHYLFISAFQSMDLSDQLDTRSNFIYLQAMWLLNDINYTLNADQSSTNNSYRHKLRSIGSRYLNKHFGIRVGMLSFDINQAKKDLGLIVKIFSDVIAPYSLEADAFKQYGLNKLELVQNKADIVRSIARDNPGFTIEDLLSNDIETMELLLERPSAKVSLSTP